MPTPQDAIILHLPQYQILKFERYNPVVIEVKYLGENRCPSCEGSVLRIKETWHRLLRHESFGERQCYLRVLTHRFTCKRCQRSFHQRLPGVLPYQRSTEGFRNEVVQEHHRGASQKDLSRTKDLGTATIERWYQILTLTKLREQMNDPAPRILGIDEHFFTRKQGYATTFCNLGKRKIHDVTLGRSEASLSGYLSRMPGREGTRIVVMDLSETYRSIAKKYFPNAQIVADRFHVVRLINQQFLKAWQNFEPLDRKNRALLSLMRRHEENLKPEQRIKLRHYLQARPVLESIYDFKQQLMRIVLSRTLRKVEAAKIIPIFWEMIQELKQSPVAALKTLGETLENWSEEIARMFRSSRTNAMTEGFHNKMEMISRRAFGFRNFQNYRMRVRIQCSI